MKSHIKVVFSLVVLVVLVFSLFIISERISSITGKNIFEFLFVSEADDLAECISQKGGKMYIIEGDSNCAAQQKNFGPSFKALEIIDCKKQAQACQEAHIDGVPALVIGNKTYYGARSLEEISKITECPL